MSRLVDKVCVITGAAGGIGAATAARFEQEGAIVVGVDLLEHSVGSLSISADITSEDAVVSMYAAARERFGRIDVLFNNAGISPTDDASVVETALEAYERVQATNLRSVFLCCKHGIPHLVQTRRRLGDQHRVVRRGDGLGHLADLVHRLEGRGAGDVP